MRTPHLVLACLLVGGSAAMAHARQSAPPVEPEEVPPPAAAAAPAAAETDPAIEEMGEELDAVEQRVDALRTGTTKFLLSGYAFSGYADREGEEASSFNGGFNPIFLWSLSDRLLFEGEVEVELEGEESVFELEYANIAYVLSPHLMLDAGLFLTPVGAFVERLHPAWINKLPDAPLAFGHGGLVPNSSLGIQLRGGARAGSSKLNYALFVVNGPTLNTGEVEPEEAGMLEFDNFEDNNDAKAMGGRLGFLPLPNLEVGVSFLTGEVGNQESEFADIGADITDIDFAYATSADALHGRLELRAEWIRSKVDRAPGLDFDNERTGAYYQAAFRPAVAGMRFLGNLEAVLRYNSLDRPEGAPESADEDRWTFGLDYRLTPSTLLKLAYQSLDTETGEAMLAADEGEEGPEEMPGGSGKSFLFQVAIGF